jgi:two-component system cell cycle response regulator DivK
MSNERFVLIVEDNDAISSMYETALVDVGFVTECILDGKDAAERLKEVVPNLVILDMNLPHVSGHYILKQIRADPRLANTYVIIVTANSPMAEALESQMTDMDMILVKPVSPIELRELALSIT